METILNKIAAESAMGKLKDKVSKAGASGLMQIKPIAALDVVRDNKLLSILKDNYGDVITDKLVADIEDAYKNNKPLNLSHLQNVLIGSAYISRIINHYIPNALKKNNLSMEQFTQKDINNLVTLAYNIGTSSEDSALGGAAQAVVKYGKNWLDKYPKYKQYFEQSDFKRFLKKK